MANRRDAPRPQTAPHSAANLESSIWTIRKWRRIAQRHGRDGLTSQLGRPVVGVNNPPTEDYFLALRRAFLSYGLPRCTSFDHGTVFFDNTSPSPFPTRLHLWLVALGVDVRFTRKRCPTDHAIIERTHQTMTGQTLIGQTWNDQTELWAGLDERREVLNTQLSTRCLDGQAPLEAYPTARKSGRAYQPQWEEDLLDVDRVHAYLAQGRWFRQVRANGSMRIGGYYYALGRRYANRTTELTFVPTTASFLCTNTISETSRSRELTYRAPGTYFWAVMTKTLRLTLLPGRSSAAASLTESVRWKQSFRAEPSMAKPCWVMPKANEM